LRGDNIKLTSFIPEGFISALSVKEYDLAELDIEVANDASYEFDNKLNELLLNDNSKKGSDEK
jgi:hypothetical protein